MDLRSGSESKRTSKRVDYNWHCICQAICSGGSQQAQSDGNVKENIDGTCSGDGGRDTNWQRLGKGDGGRKEDRCSGEATVVGWSDEGCHDLHWRSKFEKSQIISDRVEKPDGCPLLPNVRQR